MGNDLTTNNPPAGASATRSSNLSTNLAASIPAWVNVDSLDASDLHGYAYPLPANSAPALTAAANTYRAAMVPAAPDETRKTLLGLRSATIIRSEDALEAKATFSILVNHLSDVPIDILQEACRRYCNAAGARFFPKSAGELRQFINPLAVARVRRAYALDRLAKQAAEEQADRDRIAADPCTPEAAAAILREFGITSADVEAPSLRVEQARAA